MKRRQRGGTIAMAIETVRSWGRAVLSTDEWNHWKLMPVHSSYIPVVEL